MRLAELECLSAKAMNQFSGRAAGFRGFWIERAMLFTALQIFSSHCRNGLHYFHSRVTMQTVREEKNTYPLLRRNVPTVKGGRHF